MSPRIPIAADLSQRRLSEGEEQIRLLERDGPDMWLYFGTYPTDTFTDFYSPPFQNSFARAGAPYTGADGFPRVRWDEYGRLEFGGVPDATAATSGAVAFTLPIDWRPESTLSVFRDVVVSGALVESRWLVNATTGAVTITQLGGSQLLKIKVFRDNQTVTTGDGKFIFDIDEDLWASLGNPASAILTRANAFVTTVSSSGTPTIQIRNVTQAADMLSTRITIDASELRSATAATPPVIDAANDDVALGDLIAIDVDVAGTGAKGAGVNLTFRATV